MVQAGVVHGGVHLHAPAVPPAVVVPRQLPAAGDLFTGRAAELAALDRLLTISSSNRAMVISAIAGTGGIGKTWLALHWAHRNIEAFPDGQLFVDLRGFSPIGQPTAPVEAVRGFLDALGMDPARRPTDPDALVGLYRSLVAGRQMLIVLDNAGTSEQVVPLLPGGDSYTVLVTSRHRLPGLVARHGAHPLPLDVLSNAEARALLVTALGADRVAADEHAVEELIGLCRGLPLALGVIAARTRSHPHLPLSEIAAELRSLGLDALAEQDLIVSVPAVLSWSLHHLDDRQRETFSLLGIAPGPDIGLPAAANLTGLPERETHTVLGALVDACLLDRTPGGRYAMHDLVRAYAADLAHDDLPASVRRAALERVVDFYLHTAHTASGLANAHRAPAPFDPPVPAVALQPLSDVPAALAWLDAHHAHLLAAQRTAAEHHRHQVVWLLASDLSIFHTRQGRHHDDLVTWQAALKAAARLPHPVSRIRALVLLGRACSRLDRHPQAIEHMNRALALAERHHEPAEQAHIHQEFAIAWIRQGDDRRALEHLQHALDLYRLLGQPRWEADMLNMLAWRTAHLGEFDTAREHCQAAIDLLSRHPYPDGEAATHDTLGYIGHHTGHFEQSIGHYRQALALRRALGNTTGFADTLERLGHPHAALGEYEQARALWVEAVQLYREQDRDADAERVRRQLDDLNAA
ncbi:hypothetical protein GCM10010492_70460 [Saccharothrix mutabilis subsp. mutabilis]|uniref:Uncharacterized protein n=1 Tax=Saccharothrix mutabilis subsp. mutabilis TaxID=66855 RepID=A0ABN0URS5_9PSEU